MKKLWGAFNFSRLFWVVVAVVTGIWLKEQLFSGELAARIKGILGQS